MNIEVVHDARAELGECPVWEPRLGVLYWIDIQGTSIHSYDPMNSNAESRTTPGRPGSFALTAQPGLLLVAMENAVGWFNWDSGEFQRWRELEQAGTGNRLNDGRAGPAGRFWVGSMYERTEDRRYTGFLHRVEANGEVMAFRDQVGVSNGLAFSPDGSTMYWADTFHDTVWAFDYDLETGTPSNQRVFVDFTNLPGSPDGACVDVDGGYWIACVRGSAVARVSPSGEVDLIIELPVENPTMPAFGGADLDVMFVTSLRGRSSSKPDPPGTGGLLVIETGHQGIAEPHFGSLP